MKKLKVTDMATVWKRTEAKSEVYDDVERHSEGMVSFAYRPPAKEDVERLRDTDTYRGLTKDDVCQPSKSNSDDTV